MIKIDLSDYEVTDIKNRIVNKCAERIISGEFKLYGDIPDEGCYTPYDKFKNYVSNLIADRIYQYMINNDEIKIRIDKAISNSEKTIVRQYMTKNK